MHTRRSFAFALSLILTTAAAAAAQERGQIGLAMGYPGSIGVIWHLTDAVAVRPDFLFRGTSLPDAGGESSNTIGIGIAGIVYVVRDEALRLYVSPRFSYSRTSFDYNVVTYTSTPLTSLASTLTAVGLTPTLIQPQPATFETTASTKTVNGSFGAQYSLHRRFSVYGEAGVFYSWLDTSYDTALPLLRPTTNQGPRTWGTQAGAGVVVYFKD